MKVAALVPAAGAGTRLGRGPKALVEVGSKSLLARSAEALLPLVDEFLVAVPDAVRERAVGLLPPAAKVIAGGATRQESVYTLLRATQADIVLIHDAARPFLAAGVVHRVIAEVQRSGAASAVMPVADTLVLAASGEGLERSRVRAVQTPQGFRRELLLEAHRCALERGVQATDDAALVRLLGHPVALVPGSGWLMKITTPEDLEMAEAMAGAWDARA